MLVAALPLVLCWFLLRRMWADQDDAISEVLIQEFVINPPPDGPPVLEIRRDAPLPAPDADEREAPNKDGA